METFDYAAIDSEGKRQSGSIAAVNAREARDVLRARALTPVDLRAAKAKRKSQFQSGGRASHKHLTQATRQLAILIDAATPIEDALKVTAIAFDKSPIRQILLDIRSRVLEGSRLSAAMSGHKSTFSSLYTSMIAAGETSGRLAAVLERLALDLEAAQQLRRKVLAATVYPMVLTVVALSVVMILIVFVVPKVVVQFESFGQELPALTRGVIAVSNGLKAYGLIGLVAIGGSILAFRQALKQERFKRGWHKFSLDVPFVGRLIRDLNAARFARTMAGLIESGTPALSAMETAQFTVKNLVMRGAVTRAAEHVREGSPMSAALKNTKVFPPLVTQMVAGGEAGGDVGMMFAKSADYLEGEFESTTSIFMSLLEPLIIIVLSLIVLLIIGAIFLPILRLNTLVL